MDLDFVAMGSSAACQSAFARQAGRQEGAPFFTLPQLANDGDRIGGMELIALAKSASAAGGAGTARRDGELPALVVNGAAELPAVAHGRIDPITGVFLLFDV